MRSMRTIPNSTFKIQHCQRQPFNILALASGKASTLPKATIQHSKFILFPTAVSLCANAATRMGDILLFFKIFVHKKVFKLLTNISFCSYLFINISQFFVKFHKEHVRIIIFFTDISHRTIIIVFTS